MDDETYSLANQAYYDSKNTDSLVCQEDGCSKSAIKCTIPGGYDTETKSEYPEEYEYYCSEHAADEGFCCCCGTFIAGWRDFSDYCENCEDQIRYESDDYNFDEFY